MTTEWWSTSKFPSNCGYSFFMVLKQCGQWVMTFSNAYCFDVAHVLLGHHLVEVLVAQPPGHLPWQRSSAMTPKDTPARLRILTTERAMAWLRRS